MQRESLSKILDRIEGLTRRAESYRVAEPTELTVFLGEPGRAMVVGHVEEIALLDSHVEITSRDRGTLYTAYDAVHAVQRGGTSKQGPKRAGLGFAP